MGRLNTKNAPREVLTFIECLLRARHCARYFVCNRRSHQLSEVCVLIPVLRMRNLELCGSKWLPRATRLTCSRSVGVLSWSEFRALHDLLCHSSPKLWMNSSGTTTWLLPERLQALWRQTTSYGPQIPHHSRQRSCSIHVWPCGSSRKETEV